MNNTRNIGIAALIVIIGVGAWLLMRGGEEEVEIFDRDENTPDVVIFDSQAAIDDAERANRSVPIDVYVKRNVAGLSAEAGFPEVLGGTFQVTKFEASKGKGVVSYEDGHNAYTADFTYSIDKGLVTIKSFTVRK